MPAQLVLITSAFVPEAVLEQCRIAAGACADTLDEPVHFWRVRDGAAFGAALGAFRDAPDTTLETVAPSNAAAMAAAPMVWRPDGRPDWRNMWSDFCGLALFGGPPHRGSDATLSAATDDCGQSAGSLSAIVEISRGIWETTGLDTEAAGPGWLAIRCESPRMAAWMCAAIILENVDARCDGDRLLVPASESYTLEDEVKSVITVVAKTHHYWTDHLRRRQ
jgi:sirohydrochlorin cobaltochelatase